MTTIDSDRIGLFLKTNFHSNKLSLDDAKDLGLKVDKFLDADIDQDGELSLDEIEDCNNVREFLTSIITEQEELDKAKDEEEEKAEQESVSEAGGSGKS